MTRNTVTERNKGQMHNRREFLKGASVSATALALGCRSAVLSSVALGADEDWKAAFARAGFDPSAPGCTTFIVIGDPHVPWADKVNGKIVGDRSAHLADRIAEWNAMRPRP